jgi:hypothetical protein
MGLIRKVASIVTLGGVSRPSVRGSQAKAARAQAKAAEAEAGLAEAQAKVAQEQAAAIARALHEDEVHRHADLEQVAEEEAEAVPWSRPPARCAGMQAAPDRKERSSRLQPGYIPMPAVGWAAPRGLSGAAHAV